MTDDTWAPQLHGAAEQKVACFGGIYSNYLALKAAILDARRRGAQRFYCLGDMGAFGPHPDRVFPLLQNHEVICLQGNYDDSIGNALSDCQCGYTDPRDNHFAQISFDYTLENTSEANRRFLRSLPSQRCEQWGDKRVLMCHGSPRAVNEFLWESTTSTAFLNRLCEHWKVDYIFGTHTGIKWQRPLATARGAGHFVNVGALGRPENDGCTNVWYAMVDHGKEGLKVDYVPVDYECSRLAAEMKTQRLPNEFVETILSGYWTTCLEVLPAKERRRGKF